MTTTKLSPTETRLLNYLTEHGPAKTPVIRSVCSIGNISEAARQINRKYAATDIPARIACQEVPHINQYGQKGVIGLWAILELPAANDLSYGE